MEGCQKFSPLLRYPKKIRCCTIRGTQNGTINYSYVNIYIYIYVCVSVYRHVYIYIQMYIHMVCTYGIYTSGMCKYIYIYIYTYTVYRPSHKHDAKRVLNLPDPPRTIAWSEAFQTFGRSHGKTQQSNIAS